MSALAIVNEAQAILQAACAAPYPRVTVQKAPPAALVDEVILYLTHDTYTDYEKNNGGTVRRTHHIQIHLLVRVVGDTEDAEDIFLPLSDLVADTFYTNRTLNGRANTSAMKQGDGRLNNDNARYYLASEEEFYRSRWWTFDVAEDLSFNFQ